MEDREVLLGHANYSMAGYYAGADVGRLLQQSNLVLNRRGTHTVFDRNGRLALELVLTA